MEDSFLWYPRFEKMICSSLGSKESKSKILENMMNIYVKNVTNEAEFCYLNQNKALNLASQVSQVMTFFYFYWLDTKYEMEDFNFYYNKMSQLLTINLDMELIASSHKLQNIKNTNNENYSLILISKFINAFNIYLDNSTEHIITALLRSKFINKKYNNIFSSILEKIFTLKVNKLGLLSTISMTSDASYA